MTRLGDGDVDVGARFEVARPGESRSRGMLSCTVDQEARSAYVALGRRLDNGD